MSLAPRGLDRQNSITDRSPGTPTRVRSDATSTHVQRRPTAGHNAIDSPAPRAMLERGTNCNEAWDDFEGISLDFGIVALKSGISLKIVDTEVLARLPDLIALPDRISRHEAIPRTWSGDVLRLEDTVLAIEWITMPFLSNYPSTSTTFGFTSAVRSMDAERAEKGLTRGDIR